MAKQLRFLMTTDELNEREIGSRYLANGRALNKTTWRGKEPKILRHHQTYQPSEADGQSRSN